MSGDFPQDIEHTGYAIRREKVSEQSLNQPNCLTHCSNINLSTWRSDIEYKSVFMFLQIYSNT